MKNPAAGTAKMVGGRVTGLQDSSTKKQGPSGTFKFIRKAARARSCDIPCASEAPYDLT